MTTTVTSYGRFSSDYNNRIIDHKLNQTTFDEDGTIRVSTWMNTVSRADALASYRSLISAGLCATTDLQASEFEVKGTPSYISVQEFRTDDPTYHKEYILSGQWQDEGLWSGALNMSIESAKNQALQRFYANLASVDSAFQGMVFTGELREALHAIRHPFQGFRRGIGDYLSRLKKVGAKLPKHKRKSFVRDTWLEYSYGWKPMINDGDNAIKAFYNSQLVHPIFQMVRGKGYERKVQSRIQKSYTAVKTAKTVGELTEYASASVKVYGTYRSTGSGVPDAHSYGFSPSEFIPTVWELIPYSFLVDYFTNIGGILSSWSYRTLAGTWLSMGQELVGWKDLQVKLIGAPNNGVFKYITTGDPGSFLAAKRQVIRTPNIGFPLPSLALKVPGRWDQWINLAALSKNLEGSRKALRG